MTRATGEIARLEAAQSVRHRYSVPFNRPYATGREFAHISEAIAAGHLAGNGEFSRRCAAWLEESTGAPRALLTPSCTSALEMAAVLADLGPGDEVITPSFAFVSSASAIALRGATPVFVDVRPDTLNLDESLVEAAITAHTRAILPIHYAGVGCDLRALARIADAHDLLLIEDAAQGVMASYDGAALGSVGQLGCVSFHETKNIVCGEGGALLVNDPALIERAEIVQEKGTNRARFLRGQVDKYSWSDLGSSFLLGEVSAAFLWAQMEEAEAITARRLARWRAYHDAFADLEADGLLRRPVVPAEAQCNAHLYYLLLPDRARRDALIETLARRGVQACFHYVPLHSSDAGRRLGRTHGLLTTTDDASGRLVRLPLFVSMTPAQQRRAIDAVGAAARGRP